MFSHGDLPGIDAPYEFDDDWNWEDDWEEFDWVGFEEIEPDCAI